MKKTWHPPDACRSKETPSCGNLPHAGPARAVAHHQHTVEEVVANARRMVFNL
jgi:hypothetical protein